MTELPAGTAHGDALDDSTNTGLSGDRFAMHCRKCAIHHLVTETQIVSVHRTSEGLIGYVRCTAGHLVIHRFAEAYPNPKPPQAVIDLRARQAAPDRVTADRVTAEQIQSNS